MKYCEHCKSNYNEDCKKSIYRHRKANDYCPIVVKLGRPSMHFSSEQERLKHVRYLAKLRVRKIRM